MAVETWGLLPKSGDDPQTIEQAIAAAVAAHNDDNISHMGAGQSIEVHRQDSIIDHPAGSLLPDKISTSDFAFVTDFDNLARFTTSGSVSNSSWPGVILGVEDGGTETSRLRANTIGILNIGTVDKDIMFDAYFYKDTVGNASDFFVGITDNSFSTQYLGFKLDGGQIKGVAFLDFSPIETANLYAPSGGELVFVRVYYSHAEQLIYFYVNGVEEATLDASEGLFISNQFGIEAIANTEQSGVYRVFAVSLYRKV